MGNMLFVFNICAFSIFIMMLMMIMMTMTAKASELIVFSATRRAGELIVFSASPLDVPAEKTMSSLALASLRKR